MAAGEGAIDHVKLNEKNEIEFSVIGGGKPTGICGSGLLDTLAVLLDTGDVDETGRLTGGEDGKLYLSKEENIYVTAGDIRKIQLAKAAIAAGIGVLLHFAKIKEENVKTLILAGGFGSYMSLNSAARIGIFPKSLLPVAKALGNTAGEGAAMATGSNDIKSRLNKIYKNCDYIELSSISFFNDKFVDEMMF